VYYLQLLEFYLIIHKKVIEVSPMHIYYKWYNSHKLNHNTFFISKLHRYIYINMIYLIVTYRFQVCTIYTLYDIIYSEWRDGEDSYAQSFERGFFSINFRLEVSCMRINCIIQARGMYTRPRRRKLPIKPKIPLVFHHRRLRGMSHCVMASSDGVYNIKYSHSRYHCIMLCVCAYITSYEIIWLLGTLRYI